MALTTFHQIPKALFLVLLIGIGYLCHLIYLRPSEGKLNIHKNDGSSQGNIALGPGIVEQDQSTLMASSIYHYETDFHNLAMSDTECDVKFPHLFDEIERAVKRGDISGSPKELDEEGGKVQLRIYNNQLYIVARSRDVWHRQSAILHQIHRAILTSPVNLPNIFVTISVHDHPQPNIWSLARSDAPDQVNDTWLMPDFGAWSWPEPKIGTMEQIRERVDAVEKNYPKWDDKIGKAIWRGTVHWNKDIRGKLVEVAGGEEQKDWADVQELKWETNSLGMEDFCKYKFLIYTEGVTYSGRLRYLQHCRSLIFTPKLKWYLYYNPLISFSGPEQNIVEVKPDWSDLKEKVEYYRDKAPEEGERIANNMVNTFAKWYLSDAAEMCYWRKLIKGWDRATIKSKEKNEKDYIPLNERGVAFESYTLMNALDWKQEA